MATVEVESGKSVTMSELKIGDRVRTGITLEWAIGEIKQYFSQWNSFCYYDLGC